MKNAEQLQKKY